MSLTSSSLIVVSNRLPFTLAPAPGGGLRRLPAAGGLVTAVAPVVIQVGRDKAQRHLNPHVLHHLEPGGVGGMARTWDSRRHPRV